MSRFVYLFWLCILLVAPVIPAHADDTGKIQLDTARIKALADAGKPVQVIVDFRLPDATPPRTQQQLQARKAEIAKLRSQLVARNFGTELQAAPDRTTDFIGEASANRPVLVRQFDYAPALAMRMTRAQMQKLALDPSVSRITEDRLSKPSLDVSVPLIGAPVVWSEGYDGSGYTVAVLDTGSSFNHAMLRGRTVDPACFSTTSSTDHATSLCPDGTQKQIGGLAGTNCPVDNPATANVTEGVPGCFHGTHVASTAMGATYSHNGHTLAGVAKGANVMPIQIFSKINDDSSCDGNAPCILSYESDQMAALNYVISHVSADNVASVNMSLGGSASYHSACDADNASMKSLIDTLRAANVATVIAAGNDRHLNGISSPACISSAVSVGATDKQDQIADFSNSSDLVDLLAPGVDILAAYPEVGGYSYIVSASGTSMATPHVAGAFALLRSAHPSATVAEIENALKTTGKLVADPANGVIKPRIRVDLADQMLSNGNLDVGSIATSPTDGFFAQGIIGEPDTFASKTYTLTNNGSSSADWSVSAGADWIAIDQTSGTLAPGESVSVTVSVNPDQLPLSHTGQASITFASGGNSTTRSAALSLRDPVINDDFANALPLSGINFTVSGNSLHATTQAGELSNNGGSGTGSGASVWYKWTAPTTGSYQLDMDGSDFDTTLGVYRGSSLSALQVVSQNDDVQSGVIRYSHVKFNATAGQEYYFDVDGFQGDAGAYILKLTTDVTPANDNFANAIALTGPAGSVRGNDFNATSETGDPAIIGTKTVWYKWTAPASGNFHFSTQGSDIVKFVGVFTGSTLNSLVKTGSYDNESSPQSVIVNATSGATYYIGLGTHKDASRYFLSWEAADIHPQFSTALLPTMRSVQVGTPATGFFTAINGGNADAHNCTLINTDPDSSVGLFSYQATDATNNVIGSPDTPVDIPRNGTQTFVFSYTPSNVGGPGAAVRLVCDDAIPSNGNGSLNTFFVNASAAKPIDMLTIAATIHNDGILHLDQAGRTGAMAVATASIGTDGNVIFSADNVDGGVLQISYCETDPKTGSCLGPVSTSPISFHSQNGETRTFAVFVQSDHDIPFDPVNTRLHIHFRKASDNDDVGASSVAFTTDSAG